MEIQISPVIPELNSVEVKQKPQLNSGRLWLNLSILCGVIALVALWFLIIIINLKRFEFVDLLKLFILFSIFHGALFIPVIFLFKKSLKPALFTAIPFFIIFVFYAANLVYFFTPSQTIRAVIYPYAFSSLVVFKTFTGVDLFRSQRIPIVTKGNDSGQSVVNQNTAILTDKTAGWQTYRNDEYGFEIDYPPAGTVVISEGDGTVVFETKEKNKLQISWNLSTSTAPHFSGLDAEYPFHFGSLGIRHPSEGTAFDGTMYYVEDSLTGVPGYYTGRREIIINRRGVTLSLYVSEDDKDYTLYKMLDTMRFFPTEDELLSVSRWKTYRNNYYRFEFKYPENYRTPSDDKATRGLIGFADPRPQTQDRGLLYIISSERNPLNRTGGDYAEIDSDSYASQTRTIETDSGLTFRIMGGKAYLHYNSTWYTLQAYGIDEITLLMALSTFKF